MSRPIVTPWTVDDDPAVRGTDGHVVISDARGHVAALVPFHAAADADDADSEEAARDFAVAIADAINRAAQD